MKASKVCIGLVNPKSLFNVSSIMRSAGNFGVDAIFYTGTRYSLAVKSNPCPPNMSRKVSQNIPLSVVNSLIDNAAASMTIVCVELVENAIALPVFEHPENAFYIFGPEDGTVDQEIIDKADAVVYIPTISCMNLAATVNVVLYDRLAKSSQHFEGNDLIRASRDINNNVKVKN